MRAPWDTVDGHVRMLYNVVVFFKNAHGRHRSVGVATVYKLYLTYITMYVMCICLFVDFAVTIITPYY